MYSVSLRGDDRDLNLVALAPEHKSGTSQEFTVLGWKNTLHGMEIHCSDPKCKKSCGHVQRLSQLTMGVLENSEGVTCK